MTHRSYERWTTKEEGDLVRQFRGGTYPKDIAAKLGRTELAIRGRLAKHKLLPEVSLEDIEAYRSNRSAETVATTSAEGDISPASVVLGEVEVQEIKFQATLDVQQAFRRFHFVYGIVNPTGQVYIGYSQDVWHRIGQHNRDLGAVETRNCGPWFPFAIYCFAAETDARSMESTIHRDFSSYARRVEISLREVLAQIGVPITTAQLRLI